MSFTKPGIFRTEFVAAQKTNTRSWRRVCIFNLNDALFAM